MRATGEDFRTIWLKPDDPHVVQIIDQRKLPHEYVITDLRNYRDGVVAIRDMLVRGAPLIGATAAWSVYLAALESGNSKDRLGFIGNAAREISETRPTAVNLRWALERVMKRVRASAPDADLAAVLLDEARSICAEDIGISRGIGRHGLVLIEEISKRQLL